MTASTISTAQEDLTIDATARERPDRAMLEVETLKRRFGNVLAVDGVDLSIERGELVTLLGPSGSGKSTTLYMIAGFDVPTSGDIRIDGESVLALTPNQRNVGMVFQRYSLFPHMTVRDNVGFPLSVRGFSRADIRERVDRMLRLVQLDSFGHRKPSELSGGQQQRVALARALSYEPRLLLMDEPLSALDRKLREDLQQEIRQLHDRIDSTIIYVTHDQEEALQLSDRIAVFNEGRIVQMGTGEDLYRHPADSFVASFVGTSTFITAQVDTINANDAVLSLEGADGGVTVPRMQGLTEREDALIMLRPEQVRLSERPPENGQNFVRATIRSAVFLGDHVTYVATTPGGGEVKIKSSGNQRDAAFVDGRECYLTWNVEDTHVFSSWDPEDIGQQST